MATCFLFISSLIDESYISLRLNDQGQIDAPLARRGIDEIKSLQDNARTLVVVSSEWSSLHQVELPWLGERRAREALPYALEEVIAQSVNSFHIAFDQKHYQNKHYLVAVIDKTYLKDMMAHLDAIALSYDCITLDWFALNDNEVCVTETVLLVNNPLFKGALKPQPSLKYLAHRSEKTPVLVFKDSNQGIKPKECMDIDTSIYEWQARRLFNTTVINLCQGEFNHQTGSRGVRRWYQASALLVGCWLIIMVLVNAFISHQLTQHIQDLDQQIGVIYREFFPKSTHVISPKFRVEQLLKGQLSHHDMALWQLLKQLAMADQSQEFTIEQFRYQNQSLSVSLIGQDFAALEALQLRLQKAGVKVTQTQAASHEHHIIATLELRL